MAKKKRFIERLKVIKTRSFYINYQVTLEVKPDKKDEKSTFKALPIESGVFTFNRKEPDLLKFCGLMASKYNNVVDVKIINCMEIYHHNINNIVYKDSDNG